jgi:hypothetical protein
MYCSRSTYVDLAVQACLKAALHVLRYKCLYQDRPQSLLSTLQSGTVSGAQTVRFRACGGGLCGEARQRAVGLLRP